MGVAQEPDSPTPSTNITACPAAKSSSRTFKGNMLFSAVCATRCNLRPDYLERSFAILVHQAKVAATHNIFMYTEMLEVDRAAKKSVFAHFSLTTEDRSCTVVSLLLWHRIAMPMVLGRTMPK